MPWKLKVKKKRKDRNTERIIREEKGEKKREGIKDGGRSKETETSEI